MLADETPRRRFRTIPDGTAGQRAEGGRTGLTAVVVALLFLLSLFLAPIAETVPLFATAPALLFVACLMAASLGAFVWDDPTEYVPGLIIVLMMPLSFSISIGIGLGFIAYVALKVLAFLLKLVFT